MSYPKLLSPFSSKSLQLTNHVAMAPMTRSRAIGNVPNELMAKYYAQRAGAGLIISEGTSPSKNGLGYTNIPGIYSEEQVEGWKLVTDAVHAEGGKIFLQIMHVGRVAHELNLPEGGEIVAPSAVAAEGEMFTLEGMKKNGTPRAMTKEDILETQLEYVTASKNAIRAGFDGVEIHSANGYLPNQFINVNSNTRTDEYGGSIENRSRFVLELTQKVVEAIGADKTGIRISPYGTFNDLTVYEDLPATYEYIVKQLNPLGLAYLHFANMSNITQGFNPDSFMVDLASHFDGPVIFNGGYGFNLEAAEARLAEDEKFMVSIGVPFISNPDLMKRIEVGADFNELDQSTFYTPGEEGYTTYPSLSAVEK